MKKILYIQIIISLFLISCSRPVKFSVINSNQNGLSVKELCQINFSDSLKKLWEVSVSAGLDKNSIYTLDSLIFVSNYKGEIKLFRIDDGKRVGTLSYKNPIFSSLVVLGNVLIFATAKKSSDNSSLIFYDLLSGNEINRNESYDKIEKAILKYNEDVIVTCDNGKIIKFDKAGNRYWETQIKENLSCDGEVDKGNLVLGTVNGNLICLNPNNGEIIWKKNFKKKIETLSINNDNVYFSTSDGDFTKLNLLNGEIIWKIQLKIKNVAKPSFCQDKIYLGCLNGNFFCIDNKKGSIIWKKELKNLLSLNPLVFKNRILVLLNNKKLIMMDINDGTITKEFDLNARPRTNMNLKSGKLIFGIEDDLILCLKIL